MKKIILFLITITTLTNVSYASFPVHQNTQNEIVETIKSLNYGNRQPVWSILSLIFTLISLGSLSNPLAATIMALLGVIFGSIGFNKKLKGLAITGFILSLIIFLLSSLIAFTIFAYGGDPTKLGG